MATYEPSEAMRRHCEAADECPEKAMELSPALRRELDGLTDEDLKSMAQAVKVSKGAPIHLTDEQNSLFRQANQHMPTFGKTGDLRRGPSGSETSSTGTGGKYAAGGGTGGQSMSDAWAKFGGSKEAFKQEVFKPVPADLRLGRQEYIVQAVAYAADGKVAILNGGAFVDDVERAKAHAERLQGVFPWFDFHIVSMWSCGSLLPPCREVIMCRSETLASQGSLTPWTMRPRGACSEHTKTRI